MTLELKVVHNAVINTGLVEAVPSTVTLSWPWGSQGKIRLLKQINLSKLA